MFGREKSKADANSMLHVRIVEAKNLIAHDAGNTSDPYCTIKIGKEAHGQKFKTKTINETINPVWDEEFTFGVTEDDRKETLVVKIYDSNFLRDVFLGRAYIDLAQLQQKGKYATFAGWCQLLDESGANHVGGAVYIKCAWEGGFSPADEQTVAGRGRALSVGAPAAAAGDEEKVPVFDTITVSVCSWNVGNAPPPDDLSAWIPKQGHRLIVVGGQECNYTARKGYSNCNEDWIGTVSKHLGDAYYLVKDATLWEMRILVFCEAAYKHLISNVCIGSEATGIAHVLGNKGGVAVSLSYNDTSLCFINSHLAAHQTKCKARNSNFQEIVEGLNLGFEPMDVVSQFHHLIWMGDLNYRLDWGDEKEKETPDPKAFERFVAELDAPGKLDELYAENDQLRREIAEGRVFAGFTDLVPKFMPTFKVDRKAGLGYKAQRLPAWCDRVLHRSLPSFGERLRATEFVAAPEIATSDHKPVRATFEVDVIDLPPGQDDSFGAATMKFRSLKGFDLKAADLNGLSDPYVVFVAPFLADHKLQTPHIPNTLNPEWKDADVPVLPLACNGTTRLAMQYLMLGVVDRDVGSEDDYIGGGVLMMRDFLRGGAGVVHDQWQAFNLTLTSGGQAAGRLTGEVQISWGLAGAHL